MQLEIQTKDIVYGLFFPYLSAIIPPINEEANPKIERAAALNIAYYVLYYGKFVRK